MTVSERVSQLAGHRRVLVPLAALAVAVPVLAVVVPPAVDDRGPDGGEPLTGSLSATDPLPDGLARLRLRADAAGRGAAPGVPDVRSATVAVGRPEAAVRGGGELGGVQGFRTDGFAQVGATWTSGDPRVDVRTRDAGGRWSAWQELEHLHDGPDTGTAEDADVQATDLWWAGRSQDLQVRVRGPRRGLELVVIDPGTDPGAGAAAPAAAAPSAAYTGSAPTSAARTGSAVVRTAALRTAAAAPRRAPRPRILSRRQWGANESWRSGSPRYNDRLDTVHVHHTVNSNAYSRADVAPMLRGIYRYHTQSLGWSDIGYNILVDRFGRAWAGRAGGVGRKVRGAHTLGFNENGTGVAVLGNFEQVRAPKPARWTVTLIAAWKLDAEGLDPAGSGRVWSHGSDRYPRNSRPRLKRISGHRDTNETACPGYYLYRDLRGIREYAQRRADRFS